MSHTPPSWPASSWATPLLLVLIAAGAVCANVGWTRHYEAVVYPGPPSGSAAAVVQSGTSGEARPPVVASVADADVSALRLCQ